jgi:hypothetical protein
VANEFTERMRSIGYLSRGRTKTAVAEGRRHPETGVPWKATSEPGSGLITTEHATKDDRVDAVVRPATVRATYDRSTGRLENSNG